MSEKDDQYDELLPLAKVSPLHGKRQKYGSLSLKNSTTYVKKNFVTHEVNLSFLEKKCFSEIHLKNFFIKVF